MQLQEFFPAFLEFKQEEGLVPKSLREYRRMIDKVVGPAVGSIELDQLKLIDVGKVKVAGRNNGRFGEQRGVLVFRQFLRYLIAAGHKLPFDRRDLVLPSGPKPVVDWIEPQLWEDIKAAVNVNSMIGLRNRAIMEVLRCTGLRISEVLTLNRNDFDWARLDWEKLKTETIPLKVKNCKPPYAEDTVYFTYECLKWIKHYLDMRNDNLPPMFVSTQGLRCGAGTVRMTLSNSLRKAGITKRVYPHLFRKTFCTNLLFSGVDIKTVQTLARHEDAKTTLMHYTAVSKARCHDQHNRVMNRLEGADSVEYSEDGEGKKQLISL